MRAAHTSAGAPHGAGPPMHAHAERWWPNGSRSASHLHRRSSRCSGMPNRTSSNVRKCSGARIVSGKVLSEVR
eukprot:2561370-Alexandrium_andersonii.AAC.1